MGAKMKDGDTRIQINVRLPEKMKYEVKRKADKIGISFNDYVVLAIREYIKNQGEQHHV